MRRLDYFPDGLTDEIASALTRVPGLAVVARSSIYRYRGKDQDPKIIGPVLKTEYFVRGRGTKIRRGFADVMRG